jgi:hypothetical protein
MSAISPKADLERQAFDVRFVPTRDIETTIINGSARLKMR